MPTERPTTNYEASSPAAANPTLFHRTSADSTTLKSTRLGPGTGLNDVHAPALPLHSPDRGSHLEDAQRTQFARWPSRNHATFLEDASLPTSATAWSASQSPSPHSALSVEAAAETATAEEQAARPAAAVPGRRSREVVQLLHVSAWLIIFSVLGTLARLGLTALTTYPGSPVGGVAWANFAGCVVMGFLSEDRRLFANHTRPTAVYQKGQQRPTGSKTTLPLYIGLTTGFCGSFTSFSSFLLVSFDDLANISPAYDDRPTKGYNFLAFAAYIVTTLCLSYGGLQFGAHAATFLHPATPALPYRLHRTLDWLAIPTSIGVWAGAVLMAIFIPKWRGIVLFACVFAPLGSFGRFWASRLLNPVIKSFPLGTFSVNMAGTALLAGLTLGRHEVAVTADCEVLRGFGDGLCGCLTTVSTFMVELRGLKSKHAYFYGGTSVVAGVCLMIVILGSYIWTHEAVAMKC